MHRHRVARLYRHPRRHFKALKVRARVACGLEARLAESGSDVLAPRFRGRARRFRVLRDPQTRETSRARDRPSDRYAADRPAWRQHRGWQQADRRTHASLEYLIDDNLVAARQCRSGDALEPGRANRNGPRAHGRPGSVVPVQRHERAEDAARAGNDTLTE